ncbi:MAG: hypothetical protein FWH29_06240, partial [Methanobrevibacter sp.]|nr:hypothetical protein [Methanobrevibacter sp.]
FTPSKITIKINIMIRIKKSVLILAIELNLTKTIEILFILGLLSILVVFFINLAIDYQQSGLDVQYHETKKLNPKDKRISHLHIYNNIEAN